MNRFLFTYVDYFSGKVSLRTRGLRGEKPDNKPNSFTLNEWKYYKEINKDVDQIVEAAQEGEFISSVDVLLVMAHFLENEWPIPKKLSKYIATTLQNTVIAFGHTDGKVNKRNAAIAKALGLVVPRGNAKKGASLNKKLLVHLYISWRQKLYGENLYFAAKQALMAFKGTKGLSQDYCEKMYTEVENQKDADLYKLHNLSLATFFHKEAMPDYLQSVFFNDDEFLEALIPYAEDEETKELWLECLEKGKVR
jgi:hypothetical protein